MEKYYTTSEAAKILGFSQSTVFRAILKGEIKAGRISEKGGHFRAPEKEIERIKSERKVVI